VINERARRKYTREWLQKHGAKPTREQHVYRVATDQVFIPEWARQFAIPGMSSGPSLIWVKGRGLANSIAAMDPGEPLVEKFEARKCKKCKRYLIGLDASTYQKQLEIARLAGQPDPPCGISCK
jgi:hypothetical protein